MNVSAVSPSANFYDPIRKADRADGAPRTEARPQKSQPDQKLTPEELAVVQELKEIDRSVRAHEAAHMAAGAGMTSGATFTYQRGPDGGNYAVGGEVRINGSGARTPEEAIQKARQLRAAALAPADPSGQDRAVAAAATAMEQEAMAQSAQLKAEAANDQGKPQSSAVASAYDTKDDRVGKLFHGYA
jgi:hypothetical protein